MADTKNRTTNPKPSSPADTGTSRSKSTTATPADEDKPAVPASAANTPKEDPTTDKVDTTLDHDVDESAQRAVSEPGGDGQHEVFKEDAPRTNPAIETGDRLPADGTIALPQNLPAAGTGYQCGYCGVQVGREGQHYDPRTGREYQATHPGTMVVAANWPANQDAQDRKIAEETL